MNTTKKPSKVDWAIASVLGAFSLIGLTWWLLQPTPEARGNCYRRVTGEIQVRKIRAGETTIKDQQEIEAIASEIKQRCP